MAKATSIALALSLLINGMTLFCNTDLLQDKYFASNLVYLISVCVLLRRINIVPKLFWRWFSPFCLMLEVITTLAILECSLIFIWKLIKDYILLNADGLLVLLSEKHSLDWLICHFCCHRSDCPAIFATLVLKAASFAVLMTVCMAFRS